MGLDLVELIMEVERTFDVSIANADVEQARTVGQLFDVIRAQVAERDPTVGPDRAGPLWERYLALVEHELGIPRHRLQAEADFVRDLRVQ